MIQTTQPQALAMISVPWQEYITPMSPAESLSRGTVFSNLAQTYVPTIMPPVSSQSADPTMMQGMNAMSNMNTMPMPNMGMQKKR
ncbi:MAG: spore coat associated protein CotJA [Peptococcaceae bacterium]|nr:spore coat associated protein CotJA [Peptococcaceae bacterium]